MEPPSALSSTREGWWGEEEVTSTTRSRSRELWGGGKLQGESNKTQSSSSQHRLWHDAMVARTAATNTAPGHGLHQVGGVEYGCKESTWCRPQTCMSVHHTPRAVCQWTVLPVSHLDPILGDQRQRMAGTDHTSYTSLHQHLQVQGQGEGGGGAVLDGRQSLGLLGVVRWRGVPGRRGMRGGGEEAPWGHGGGDGQPDLAFLHGKLGEVGQLYLEQEE